MLQQLFVLLFASSVFADPEFPKFVTQKEKIFAEEGSYIELPCNNATGDLPITYRWYTKFGEEVRRFKIRGSVFARRDVNGSTLVFDGIREDEAGYYVCWARNNIGASRKFYTVVIVEEAPPAFETRYEALGFEEGSLIEVLCNATGYPTPNLTWHDPYGHAIGDWGMDNVRSLASANGSTLVIADARTHQSGIYTCTASNTHGAQTKLFRIDVNSTGGDGEMPSFDSTYEMVEYEKGSFLEILCNATGIPKPNIIWYDQYEDEIARYTSGRYTRRDWNGTWLVITSASSNHSGIYTCVANNTFGLQSKVYELVLSDDGGNFTNNETVGIRIRTVTVTDTSLEFAADDNYYNIQVVYSEKLNASSSYRNFRRGQRILIDQLVPSGKYAFRFNADGDRSTNRTVTLLPAAPDVVLYGLKDGTLDIQWWSKYNDFLRDTIFKHTVSYYTVQQHGDVQTPDDCVVTVEIPKCAVKRHIVAGIPKNVLFEVAVRAHTAAGAGAPYKQKIFLS